MSVIGPGAGSLPAGSGGAGGSGLGNIGPVVGGTIVDQAFNPLAQPTSSVMLGAVEEISPEEELKLRIYLFLIETIRIEDAIDGNLFVKRYLDGPQIVWHQLRANIFAIKDLWSIVDIKDEHLQYLKRIVGWTSDLDHVTDSLDYDTLRRLIASSTNLWKNRGPVSTISRIITLVTGARNRLWDWFDFRWVADEEGFGHENDGYDPWLISVDNDMEMNFRVANDGTLDKYLVVNLLKIMRPVGERIEITYLSLLDLFRVDGDITQWSALNDLGQTGAVVLVVQDGSGQLNDDAHKEEMYANASLSPTWEEFVYSARIRGSSSFGLTFYRQDVDNYYMFRLKTSGVADNFDFIKVVAGVETIITTTPAPPSFLVDSLLYYMFRVQITKEGSITRVVCFVDGNELINATDYQFASGTVGISHAVGGVVEVDEVEVLSLPTETDFIDINS